MKRAARDKRYRLKNLDAVKERQAEWRAANTARIRERDAKRRLKKRASCLIAGARTRARIKKLPFDLDLHVEELQRRLDVGVCELSGVQFDLSPGRKAFSPSLDRIVPALGYTFDNVRVICHAMNTALGDWGVHDFRLIAESWLAKTSNHSSDLA